MSSQRVRTDAIATTALIAILSACCALLAAPQTAPGTSQNARNDDILIGGPSSAPPELIIPFADGSGDVSVSEGGVPLLHQFFVLDPSTHKVGLAQTLPRGVSMQQSYANKLIDPARLKSQRRIFIGRLLSSQYDRYRGALIDISFENHSRVLVSSNYIVSRVGAGGVAARTTSAGHFVRLIFDSSDDSKFIDGTLT
jgi:hypothetical protein